MEKQTTYEQTKEQARTEMYKKLEARLEATNLNDRNSIRAYNEYARSVRKEFYERYLEN